MDNRYTSRQHTAKDAMSIQDACNVRGVLKTAHDMACFIGAEGGNPAMFQAPELVLMVSKIASLVGCEGPSMAEFSKAWEACEAMAQPAQV